MEGVESKSQSPGQDTQIMPENSVFLAENVDGFQHCVNEILSLIEQNEKKSKLTTLVTELSRMHMALADENVHLIQEFSKNIQKITTPIKTEHVGSSTSTTPQVTLDTDGGGFNISTRKGSESSFGLSSNSESESSISISKHLKSKLKETKVHDPDALLKKIKTLEKEQISLKKQIKNLTDENALLEAEKSNVAELKHMISQANRKVETMGKVLKASRKQFATVEDQNLKMVNEMSSKVFGKIFDSVEDQSAIEKRDEQITELSTEINQLKIAHAADVDKLNNGIEMLKTKLKENDEFMQYLTNMLKS